MTTLDGYILFVIGFAIFALWVAHQAEAAIKRLRENARRNEGADASDSQGASGEKGAEQ